MATYALFIDEKYLREFSPLSANIDVATIFPYARSIQDMILQDTLGTSLYDTLQAHIVAGTVTANETILLNYCRSALAWLTVETAIPFVWMQIRNIGVQQSTTDNGTSADLANMKYLRNECAEKSEFYMKRLKEYLCNNGNLFPDYTSPDSEGMQPNTETSYDSGLYLGNSNGTQGQIDLYDWYKKYIG